MAVQSQLVLQQFQMTTAMNASQTGLGDGNQAAMMFQQMVEQPLAGFSEPRSELTCNQLSGSRKRAREEPSTGLPTISTAMMYHQQRKFLLQKQQVLLNQIQHKAMHTTADVAVESSRIVQSAMTSTSGRPPLALSASAELSNVSAVHNNINGANNASGVLSSSNNLITMMNYQTMEMENLIRLHEQNLRSGLQEMRKRQCTALVSVIQQEAQRRIDEKQAELVAAAKRSAELEDRLREASAESQAWFNVAKNSEALVTGLRASLEQALLQKVLSGGNNNGNCASRMDFPGVVVAEEEGYGDSEEQAGAATAVSVLFPEASSSMVGVAARNDASAAGGCRLRCRSCGERDACVLLLPCRHLCLCPSCESSVNDCPVCGVGKNTALRISLSY